MTWQFQYVRDGWGLMGVFHHEELGVDFDGPVDPDVLDRLWEGGLWEVWRVDLENKTAAPVKGLERGMFGGYTQIDRRLFLTVTDHITDNWSTRLFELFDDGSATLYDECTGEGGWMRVR